MEVLAPPEESDSVHCSLPDIAAAASTTDKDRVTLSGYYSNRRTSVQLKVQNLFPDQILKKDIIITPTPSGPASFPLHKRRKSFRMQLLGLPKDEPDYFTLPGFTFGNLAAVPASHPTPVMEAFRKTVVSRCNYQKLTTQLTNKERKSIQTEVNRTILSSNEAFPVISQRKPERQNIIEMALEEKMRKPNSSEQILEDGDEGKESFMDSLKLHGQSEKVFYSEPDHTLDDDTIKGIQGSGYQNLLGEQDEQEKLMARSRMAVLYCTMHRRTELNLKAYFLTFLPDLTPLVDTLVCLNLSFNDLHFFPREIYNIKNLEVLKLRNNPIKEIPDDVHKLKTLRILNISFNLLSVLPT
ncbi:leucine rich repeat containing 63, partial [Chelydra serpentina]